MAAKNAIFSWLLNFRIRTFVKSTVNVYKNVTVASDNHRTISNGPFVVMLVTNCVESKLEELYHNIYS